VERLGRLSIGPLGVFFDGRRIAASADLRAEGVVFDPDDAPLVRLAAGGQRVEVRVPDVDEAQRLLDAVRPAPSTARVVRLPSRIFADYAVLLTIAFPIVGLAWHVERGVAITLLAFAVIASAALVTGLARDTVIALRSNGLLIAWLLGRRFIPFEHLESARLLDESTDLSGKRRRRVLALHLRDGQVLRFPADEANADQLALVLQHARAGAGRGRHACTEEALERRGMTLPAWIEALRAIARGEAASHRTAPVAHETLWSIVEDDGSRAETRAAAAVVLLESLGDAARPPDEAELEAALAEAADAECAAAGTRS
jgi:hypothetical protein